MHPLALRAAMVAAAWFVLAMAISFTDSLEAGYLMAIVIGFSVIFFAPTLGMSFHATHHGQRREPSFRDFLSGKVGIYTGWLSGREALVQLLTLPVTLAPGGMAIGLVYLFAR